MSEIGDMLREAREARGISLPQAERETKIRAKYLAAIEDDHPGLLPGPVYARGFIRNYALYLDINPNEAAELFDKESQPARTRIRANRGEQPIGSYGTRDTEAISIHPLSPEPLDTRVRYGSSYIAVSLLAIPLLILFYFIYNFWGGNRSGNVPIPTPRPPTLTPIQIPTQFAGIPGSGVFNTPTVAVALSPGGSPGLPITSTFTAGGQASPTTLPTGRITVKVTTTRDSWMRVTLDGIQQFVGTLPANTSRQWTGKNTVRIRTGRADAVQVTVNGTNRGFMNVGSDLVVEKEWDTSGNEKLIR